IDVRAPRAARERVALVAAVVSIEEIEVPVRLEDAHAGCWPGVDAVRRDLLADHRFVDLVHEQAVVRELAIEALADAVLDQEVLGRVFTLEPELQQWRAVRERGER